MTTSPPRALDKLASCYLHDPRNTATLKAELAHRLNLASAWGIQPGWAVLDVGCGTGDSTLAVAEAVGEAGHVTGIDPGSPDEGTPSLGQSQAYILRSRMGPRISFHRADAPSYIASLDDASTGPTIGSAKEPTSFDAATLCHSLWYFDSRGTVQRLFEALGGRVKRVLLAEYTGEARTDAQEPHALAAQVQVQFYHAQARGEGEGPILPGVREALRPAEIVREAQAAGWRVAAEGVLEAPEGMADGKTEVQSIIDPAFTARLMSFGVRGTTAEMLGMVQEIRGMKDALARDGQDVATMDVAWVVLEKAE
jgi:SAM-dependent methyltransferase